MQPPKPNYSKPSRLNDEDFLRVIAAASAKLQEFGYAVNNRSVNILVQDLLLLYPSRRLRYLDKFHISDLMAEIESWTPSYPLHQKLKFTLIHCDRVLHE